MFKNYNMNQLVLPLDLEVPLQENDIAFAIHHLVESIPERTFDSFQRQTGCPSYHPRMMLKIILCGYTQSVFSGRKIEDLTKDSIRMMWLAQGYEPSYRTINRFRVHPDMKELIRQCFVQFRVQLVQEKIIDQEAILLMVRRLKRMPINSRSFGRKQWKNIITISLKNRINCIMSYLKNKLYQHCNVKMRSSFLWKNSRKSLKS